MIEIKTIGRRETARFPVLKIEHVEVKIDTGAYTSSIHCSKIEETGNGTVRCIFLDPENKAYTGLEFEFPIVKETLVRSSNGETEKRFMIRTQIELLGRLFKIFLTLTDRGDMKYPVLIGRRFLANKFIVDVRLKNQTKDL